MIKGRLIHTETLGPLHLARFYKESLIQMVHTKQKYPVGSEFFLAINVQCKQEDSWGLL